MTMKFLGGLCLYFGAISRSLAWTSVGTISTFKKTSTTKLSAEKKTTTTWFPKTDALTATQQETEGSLTLDRLKVQILQLGAALDRGQAYNPTSGPYYNGTMAVAKSKIEQLIETSGNIPTKLQDMEGEWELVLSTVPHGIFRSSPFFLAIQESYEYAVERGKEVWSESNFISV